MSDWIQCPACGLKHSARPDGQCPRCRNRIAAGPAATPPRPATGAAAVVPAPAGANAPHVLAVFEARQANTWTMDRMYDVHVASDRFVCARTGGQLSAQGGSQAIWMGVLFGALGGLIAGALAKPKVDKAMEKARRETAHLSLDELATAHKHSFAVRLGELESLEVQRVRLSFHGPAVAALKWKERGGRPMALQLVNQHTARTCVAALRQVAGAKLRVDPALQL